MTTDVRLSDAANSALDPERGEDIAVIRAPEDMKIVWACRACGCGGVAGDRAAVTGRSPVKPLWSGAANPQVGRRPGGFPRGGAFDWLLSARAGEDRVAAVAGIIEFVVGKVAGGCSHGARHPRMLLSSGGHSSRQCPRSGDENNCESEFGFGQHRIIFCLLIRASDRTAALCWCIRAGYAEVFTFGVVFCDDFRLPTWGA
jgi:hypothetical protein